MHIKITQPDSGQHDTFKYFKQTLNFCFKNNSENYSKCKTNCNLSIMLQFQNSQIIHLYVEIWKKNFTILYERFYYLDKKHDLVTTQTLKNSLEKP